MLSSLKDMNMRTRILPVLFLLAAFLASCAPGTAPVAPELVTQPTATFPPPVPTLDQSSQPMPGVTEAPTEAIEPTSLPVATSRGPNLEATDPTTVSLASGEIQFVEFFRYT